MAALDAKGKRERRLKSRLEFLLEQGGGDTFAVAGFRGDGEEEGGEGDDAPPSARKSKRAEGSESFCSGLPRSGRSSLRLRAR